MTTFIHRQILTIFSISIVIISFGLIPHSLGGSPPPVPSQTTSVDATINIVASCGITVVDSPVTLSFGSVAPDLTVSDNFQVENGGTSLAEISANVGDELTGGFAGISDGITHIAPSSIALDLGGNGLILMNDLGTDTIIGVLSTSDASTPTTIDVQVTAILINLPFDGAASSTITFTVTDCGQTLES